MDFFLRAESLFLNGPIKITNMSRFAKQTHLFKLASAAGRRPAGCIKIYVYIRCVPYGELRRASQRVGGETLSATFLNSILSLRADRRGLREVGERSDTQLTHNLFLIGAVMNFSLCNMRAAHY
jgi:hypothetical protein